MSYYGWGSDRREKCLDGNDLDAARQGHIDRLLRYLCQIGMIRMVEPRSILNALPPSRTITLPIPSSRN